MRTPKARGVPLNATPEQLLLVRDLEPQLRAAAGNSWVSAPPRAFLGHYWAHCFASLLQPRSRQVSSIRGSG